MTQLLNENDGSWPYVSEGHVRNPEGWGDMCQSHATYRKELLSDVM